MPPITLFFDLDGPILDTAARNFQVHRAILRELGREMTLDQNAFWELKRAGTTSAALLSREPGPPLDVERFKHLWLEEIERPRWLALDTVQVGAKDTLNALSRSFRLALVTLRQVAVHLEDQLARLNVGQYFPLILCASPLEGQGWESKRRLIAAHGFSAGDVIVGDTETDIRAGKLLGLTTIAVLSGIRNHTALLAEHPDCIIEGIMQVPRILSSIAHRPGHESSENEGSAEESSLRLPRI